MKSFYDRFAGKPETSQDNFRKSFDVLVHNKSVKIKNQNIYKPLKKPLWVLQDQLYFVHRSPNQTRSTNYAKPSHNSTPLPPSPPCSPPPKCKEMATSVFKIFKEKRAKTPVDSIFKILVKTSKLCDPTKIVKKKTFGKRELVTSLRKNRYAKKQERIEEFSDLQAWDHESSGLFYINNY